MSGWGTIYNNTMYSLRLHSAELARLQEQITRARVVRASDDPSDAHRILQLRAQSLSIGTYRKNLSTVDSNLDQACSIVGSISTGLGNAKGSLSQVLSSTYDQSHRLLKAQEIDSLLEDVVMWANSERLGQYLFSGASVQTRPYVVETDGGRITSVQYQGSLADLPAPVAPGVEYSAAVVGDEVFRCDDRAEPIFLGDTGAKAGAGTSSARGDVWLIVTHDTTTYEDGGATGVAPGTGSATGDTIAGASHELIIDADAKTVTLDDGQAVSYTGTETNLAVRNLAGDTVYVDLSGLAGGLSGTVTVPITATVKLSIDDGASTTAAGNFSLTNLAVADSRTGRVLFVDPSGMSRAGVEPVRIPGTYDVFGTLINLRDVLENARGLPESQQMELAAEAIESLAEVHAGVTLVGTTLGGRLEALERMGDTLEDFNYSLSDEAGALEAADIVQVATELARAQTFYEATLATAARLLSLSLLDFI